MGKEAPRRPEPDRILGVDRLIHEPARLLILAHLASGEADFTTLLKSTGLTRGNLAAHLAKLSEAKYVAVEKRAAEEPLRTRLALTRAGRSALKTYRKSMRKALKEIRG